MPTIRVLLATACFALAVGLATDDARSTSSCVAPSRSDRPAATAGRSIRLLYAYPSDGADRSAERAAAMAADVASITSWWRSQDPAREPRFDVWESPCGATPDIGVLRLPDPSVVLEPADGRAARITAAVQSAGDGSPFTKYLVYYDGPAASSLCGQGNGQPDGSATAIVFLAACPSVPSALVAAHELLHALGGAPVVGPPHECPTSPQHVCDSSTDILAPVAPRRPLATTVLDVGRDDYYGHSGSWLDLQDSRWLRLVDAQVEVTVDVDGRGSVLSTIPGIDCADACTTSWDRGTFVVLEARPASGQRLVDWGGACDGMRACSFDATRGSTTVRARFGPARVGLELSVHGRGAIAAPGGRCVSSCRRAVASFSQVTLRAVPAIGWRFARWQGRCAGSAVRCTVSTASAVATRAIFVRRR